MNTYLIPTTEEFGNEYKNIIVIYAESGWLCADYIIEEETEE